jgi:uncharacterized protein YjaZ
MIRELLDFKSFVDKDFRKIFSFRNFFNTVKNKIEQKYNSSITNIKSKINQTSNELQQNSRFYNKFRSSSAYSTISRTSS